MSKEEILKTTANIIYCGYELSNVHLGKDLEEFKAQFINLFSLENLLSNKDITSITYKDERESKKAVNTNEDYIEMLKFFLETKNKKIIYIETEKMPVYFEGEKSVEFEDEINKVVERELLIAANNIKKCLTTNISYGNSKKVRTQSCKGCGKQIIGYLYKKVSENDEYYCEFCSSNINEPLFKIN